MSRKENRILAEESGIRTTCPERTIDSSPPIHWREKGGIFRMDSAEGTNESPAVLKLPVPMP